MSKITYTDKVALNVNPNIADINKVNDTDMNMIKDVVNANETKILLAVSDTAPAECSLEDMYFDTTDNLIYTATGTNTWSSTGEAPTENTIYVVIDTQTSYIYDGTTLISVGGGSGGIVVAPDTPTEDTILYIESTDIDGQYEVIDDVYSTSEVKTNKVWTDGKPIYRKVFNATTPSTSNSDESLLNLTNINISEIISFNGILKRSNGQSVIANSYYDASYNTVFYFANNNDLHCKVNGYTSTNVTITIEYTKSS